jgi:hypothetical protein
MGGSMVTRKELTALEGKDIADLCDARFWNSDDNHCAHFVCHTLGYTFGYTCKKHTGKGTKGACLRVHEVFEQCPAVGLWKDRSKDPCLVFITDKSRVNLKTRKMDNHPRKHIGIFCDGEVWHYSNTGDEVVRQTPEEVLKRFKKAYSPDKNIELFFGAMP